MASRKRWSVMRTCGCGFDEIFKRNEFWELMYDLECGESYVQNLNAHNERKKREQNDVQETCRRVIILLHERGVHL